MRLAYFIPVIFFLVVSCDSSRVYEDQVTFKDRIWKVSEPAVLEFQIENTTHPYHLFLNVRNTVSYPYARLFTNYTLVDSLGNELSQKLISQFLFDQKTGKPFGNKGLSDIYDHQFMISKNFLFPHPGRYKIKFEQYMRQDTLPGVLAIGLRVENANH